MPKERRDKRFTFPDEVDEDKQKEIFEIIQKAETGELALLMDESNFETPAMVVLFSTVAGLSMAHTLSRDACIEIARQLLDAAGIATYVFGHADAGEDVDADNFGKVG